MAILGLLIERPDQTVAEVAEELKVRFARSRFDPATASHTLRRMAHGERTRPRVRRSYESPGSGRKLDRYRATLAGMDEFRSWMYARPTGVPALREALYGRIELCQLEDLPELIRIAREEASIATDFFSETKTRLSHHLERNRRKSKREEPGPKDYLQEVRNVLLHITPEYWSARSIHNEEIARHLERVAERAGVQFEAAP
jgi:hypothetical protein